MSSSDNQKCIREVIGIFLDGSNLKAAIEELESAEFGTDQIGLLASDYAVENSLGDLYQRVNEPQGDPGSPATRFVEADSLANSARSMGGGLFFAGTAAAGGVVASAAVLGGVLLPAVVGVATVGAVGALIGKIIHQSDAEYLEQQVGKGHILLFVRAPSSAREKVAMDILKRHSGQDVRVHEVPLKPAA